MSTPRRGDPPPPPEPLDVEVFDSHCHLDAMGCRDAADVAAELDAARAVGVRRVITVGDTVLSSRWCADIALGHPDVYAAVAIHPNETGTTPEADYAEIARLAQRPEVRAVGETGLDYHWKRVEPAVQQDAFRRHIDIAKRVGKPLVIHDRDAHDDVLRILDEEGAPQWTVFHCFSGNAEMAGYCVDRGYVLSIAGTVTFGNAGALRDALRAVPVDRLVDQLLVETDAPFLTPVPYRGRRNAPYLIPLTIRAISQVLGVDPGRLCAAISTTGKRVFGNW